MKARLFLISACLSTMLVAPSFAFAFEDLTQATITCVQANLSPLEKLQKEIQEEVHGKEDVGINMLPYPIVKYHGSLGYVSGGISADEVRFMQCMQPYFPLTLVFVERIDTHPKEIYTADVHVQLSNATGELLFDSIVDGPFLLIDLAAGNYKLTADLYGKIKERNIKIYADKRKRSVFVWDNRTTESSAQN